MLPIVVGVLYFCVFFIKIVYFARSSRFVCMSQWNIVGDRQSESNTHTIQGSSVSLAFSQDKYITWTIGCLIVVWLTFDIVVEQRRWKRRTKELNCSSSKSFRWLFQTMCFAMPLCVSGSLLITLLLLVLAYIFTNSTYCLFNLFAFLLRRSLCKTTGWFSLR